MAGALLLMFYGNATEAPPVGSVRPPCAPPGGGAAHRRAGAGGLQAAGSSNLTATQNDSSITITHKNVTRSESNMCK